MIGDVVINPHVKEDYKNKPNPQYRSMVIHEGTEYTTCLRFDGKTSKYYTHDIKNWKVERRINLYEMLKFGASRVEL